MTETNQDINKYLAGVIGICWHDKITVRPYKCDECGHIISSYSIFNEDYHTPSGFFKLLEWMEGQDNYHEFLEWMWGKTAHMSTMGLKLNVFVHNLHYKIAPTLCYQWLKEER